MNEHPSTLIDVSPSYTTPMGSMYCGDSLDLISRLPDESINLVITSPPFSLQRKKEYGNESQETYVDWLLQFGRLILPKLKKDGSFVVDIGGAYKKGVPVRSLYPFEVLLGMCNDVGFHLAEDFYWFNPSKLPSPIEWVNKRKLRVKDSVNTVWWFSRGENPKSDVTKVLVEYSERMKTLIKDPEKFYTPKVRPSGHDIGSSFRKDNGGAIPSNLLQIPNSESNGFYLRGCKVLGLPSHPARFPSKLPEFFIRMLTEPGDVVLDIFSGSNTTGMVSENEGRRWLSFELSKEYVSLSVLRFLSPETPESVLRDLHSRLLNGESIDVSRHTPSVDLLSSAKRKGTSHN